MELGPFIDRILGPRVLRRSSLQNNGPLVLGRSRPSKNGRRSDRWPQNVGKVKNPRPEHLGASPSINTFVGFPLLRSQNRPTIPSLNISIIPWKNGVSLYSYSRLDPISGSSPRCSRISSHSQELRGDY